MKKIIFILALTLSAYHIYSQTDRDKRFVASMARIALLEIKLGELAQTNGLAIEVKDMGKHMIDDHTKAREDLKLLAERKNISFPTVLNDKQQKVYNKMAKLKGSDFDKHYAKCMSKSHKKIKCEMKKEVKKGNDVDLQSWAQTNLPSEQRHQDITKAARTSIKKNK